MTSRPLLPPSTKQAHSLPSLPTRSHSHSFYPSPPYLPDRHQQLYRIASRTAYRQPRGGPTTPTSRSRRTRPSIRPPPRPRSAPAPLSYRISNHLIASHFHLALSGHSMSQSLRSILLPHRRASPPALVSPPPRAHRPTPGPQARPAAQVHPLVARRIDAGAATASRMRRAAPPIAVWC
jgi:hypothetical protein